MNTFNYTSNKKFKIFFVILYHFLKSFWAIGCVDMFITGVFFYLFIYANESKRQGNNKVYCLQSQPVSIIGPDEVLWNVSKKIFFLRLPVCLAFVQNTHNVYYVKHWCFVNDTYWTVGVRYNIVNVKRFNSVYYSTRCSVQGFPTVQWARCCFMSFTTFSKVFGQSDSVELKILQVFKENFQVLQYQILFKYINISNPITFWDK